MSRSSRRYGCLFPVQTGPPTDICFVSMQFSETYEQGLFEELRQMIDEKVDRRLLSGHSCVH